MAYASYTLNKIVSSKRMQMPDVTMVELKGMNAVPRKIDEALEKYDPVLFVAIGHGYADTYLCECNQPYMVSDDNRVKKMSGRIVILVSCLTAKNLGPSLIENGALAYYGSRGELWFFIRYPPCSGRTVKSVFSCELQPIISLMEGKTTGEAQQERLERYEKEIEYWTTGPGKNHPDAPLITNMLIIDKNIAVFLGNEDIRITEGVVATPTPARASMLPAAVGLMAMMVGSATVKKAEKLKS